MSPRIGTGVIVVGGSIAGVRTVEQLRHLGYDGSVTLVEAQSHAPYDRPPLSKEVLLEDVAVRPTLLSTERARELEVQLLLGVRATRLSLESRAVELADGRSVEYQDALVVATGARARRSPWPTGPRVLALRDWDDATRLREVLDTSGSLVVVGAGFIGAEVAGAARKRGIQVSLVDVLPRPMARHLGDEVGELFVDLHHRHGAKTYFGATVEFLASTENHVEVGLGDGTRLTADAAVVGLGTELNVEWLGSTLEMADGLICDEFSRADVPHSVYAVGDVARWWHVGLGRHIRSEHWTNAVEQAAVVAHNIVHPEQLQAHAPVSYVWSNQYDWKIQIAGLPADGIAQHRVAGKDEQLAVLYGRPDDGLCGVLTINWPAASVRGRKALRSGASVDEAAGLLGAHGHPSAIASAQTVDAP
jgi:NADPH-dependent 2,4-dienoyl-CoA reductase/sulfur reductase-like enzyme